MSEKLYGADLLYSGDFAQIQTEIYKGKSGRS